CSPYVRPVDIHWPGSSSALTSRAASTRAATGARVACAPPEPGSEADAVPPAAGPEGSPAGPQAATTNVARIDRAAARAVIGETPWDGNRRQHRTDACAPQAGRRA